MGIIVHIHLIQEKKTLIKSHIYFMALSTCVYIYIYIIIMFMSMFLDTLLTNKIDHPRSKTMYISEHSSFGLSFVSL